MNKSKWLAVKTSILAEGSVYIYIYIYTVKRPKCALSALSERILYNVIYLQLKLIFFLSYIFL